MMFDITQYLKEKITELNEIYLEASEKNLLSKMLDTASLANLVIRPFKHAYPESTP